MKVIPTTHSSVARANGANDHTFARNGKVLASLNARPQKRSDLSIGFRAGRENGPPSLTAHFSIEAAQPLRAEFFPIAAGQSQCVSGLPARATSENEIVFFYCVKGRGRCEIERRCYELMPGQMLVMPAHAERKYTMYAEHPWSLIWMQFAVVNVDVCAANFSKDELPRVPQKFGRLTPQPTTLGAFERTEMLALFQDVLQAFDVPSPQRLVRVSQRVARLVDASISSRPENDQREKDAVDKIGRTIDYMKQHLNEPLRAATLAGVANMSLPHYFALFKRVVGRSPIDYLIKLRMEHARRLLADTSWSVKEVAVSLGYDDPLYFSRVFKSINQTAPSDFRARTRHAGER